MINQELAQGFALQMPYFENKNFTCACISLFSVFCLKVFFSVAVGAMQLGQAGPYFQAIVTARGAAYKVFLIIDRVKIYIYILFKGS